MSQLQHRKLYLFLVRVLGWWSCRCGWLVSWVGYGLFRIFAGTEIKKGQINIEKIFGLPPHAEFHKQFLRQNIQTNLIIAQESLAIITRYASPQLIGQENLSLYIRKARGMSNQGVIIVTAHLGSWELTGYVIAKILNEDCDFYVLAKPTESIHLNNILETIRYQAGAKVLWSNSKNLLREMMHVLRQNSVLGMVVDQKPKGRQGWALPFLGYPADFVKGPASLACKLNVPVIGAYTVRVGKNRYQIITEVYTWQAKELNEEALTQKMVAHMEKLVQTYPEQWTWTYKRWKFSAL